ncbi:FHA domain-containing protein, partial [Meloidogyne graminicola]
LFFLLLLNKWTYVYIYIFLLLIQENSKKYGNILLMQQTLIGSNPECDIVIKCPGVRSKHALIEYSQKTSSYWLKQLMPSFEEKQKEINKTKNLNIFGEQKESIEEILNDGSLIELRHLDKLLFGNGPNSVEFIFKIPSKINKEKIGKSDNKQKLKRSNSCCSSVRKKTLKELNEFSLPIVGNKIKPKPYIDKFIRPINNNNKLCQLKQQQNKQNELINNNNQLKSSNKDENENDLNKNKKIKEETKHNQEINSENNITNKLLNIENSFQEALAKAYEENEHLRSELLIKKKGNKKIISSLNEIVYETFFQICNEEMDILNKRILNMTVRDYSDIFAEINKILHEPFSFRLMEINSKCSVIFETLKLEPLEKEELYIQLDYFLKKKIYPISKAIDSFLGTLKESAIIAKESTRACIVFSQWSREFGDQLQLNPDWNLMIYKVRDLQNRFKEQGLPKHWLPPSLIPILEILIFERKNWIDERQKRENQMVEAFNETNEKIKKLEKELNNKNQLIGIPKIEVNQTETKRANSIQFIRLPISNESPTIIENNNEDSQKQITIREEKESMHSSKKPLSPRTPQSPKTPRSALSSYASFKLISYASEDYESSKQHSPLQEAHIDSPNTPPPSNRVSSVLDSRPIHSIELRELVEAVKITKESKEDNEEDETPWGDKLPESLEEKEEKKSENENEGNILIKENINKGENYQQILISVEQEDPIKEIIQIPRECTNNINENCSINKYVNLNKEEFKNDQEKEENNFKLNENNNLNELINNSEENKDYILENLFPKILNNAENIREENNEIIDQEEFEQIEKIILQTKNKNVTQEKSNKTKYSVLLSSKVPSCKTFEFWGLAHSLANILNMELPSRETVNYQNYSSLSRPQSAGEFDARQKAVDSIQERLKSMMNELERIQNENKDI